MMMQPFYLPKLQRLPLSMPKDGAISITLEDGTPIFRASITVQKRIFELLEKQRAGKTTKAESDELDRYEEIDDYLSHLNRTIRNMLQEQNQ